MSFWKKYNKYLRMVIIVGIYYICLFTELPFSVLNPLREILGTSLYGCQSMAIFANVIIYMVVFVFSILLVPEVYYVDFKIFKKTPGGKKALFIGAGFGGLLILSLIGNILTMTFGGVEDSVNESTIDMILKADIAWLYIPVVCVIGPIVEEIVFRGVIQSVIIGNKFQKPSNPRVFIGVIGASLVFALIHVVDAGDYVQIFPYLFMGLALGSVTYLSKSIYPSIFIHIINNTIATLSAFAIVFFLR